MNPNPTKTMKPNPETTVAEVTILWSETTLDVAQLGRSSGEQTSFSIGEDPSCDSWIGLDHLTGRSRMTLVTLDGDQPVAHVPANAGISLIRPTVTMSDPCQLQRLGLATQNGSGDLRIPLEEGWVAEIEVGELTYRVRRTTPDVLERAATPVDWNSVTWTGASFLIHAAFLGLIFAIPPDPSSIALDGAEGGNRFVSYLIAPVEVDMPDIPDMDEPTAVSETTEEQHEQGAAHGGESGQMGDPDSSDQNRHYTIRDRGGDEVRLAQDRSRDAISERGILAVLQNYVPTSPFANGPANGFDPEDQLGQLLGAAPGTAFGLNGLGVRGSGRGGGNRNESIGLGTLNGIGGIGTRGLRDRGRRRAALNDRDHTPTSPRVRVGSATVSGTLAREVIRRQIRLRRAEVTHCYQRELTSRPDLAGRVTIRFVIDAGGRVISAAVANNNVGSGEVGQCVANVIRRISFPPPGNGVVVVNYPFTFMSN